ncbi:hypothetical protein PI125_g16206 [Phytophthora idaei]|nr:hypothetical protein PI125_g16206 [Phytophthora idaei]
MRITWSYVARRMAKSKRTGSELRLRLTSLKRPYGKTLSRFPPCFFLHHLSHGRGCIVTTPSTALPCMEALDLEEPEAASSNELEKAKAVVGSHAPTTEVAATARVFETVLGWDEQDHVWWAST